MGDCFEKKKKTHFVTIVIFKIESYNGIGERHQKY